MTGSCNHFKEQGILAKSIIPVPKTHNFHLSTAWS